MSGLIAVEPVARNTHAIAGMQVAGRADIESAYGAVVQLHRNPVAARRRRARLLTQLIARDGAAQHADRSRRIASMAAPELVADHAADNRADHGACDAARRHGAWIRQRLDRRNYAVLLAVSVALLRLLVSLIVLLIGLIVAGLLILRRLRIRLLIGLLIRLLILRLLRIARLRIDRLRRLCVGRLRGVGRAIARAVRRIARDNAAC